MNASSPMHSWPFEGKVSNEWFNRGAWLFQAAEIFADEYQITQFRQHAERFAELRDGERPEIFEQSTTLSGAAGKKELLNRLIFDEEKDAFRLYLAFKDQLQMTLKNKLYSGSLVAYGARGASDADFVWIPTRAWYYLHVHLDEGNVVRGEGTVYFHVRVIDSRDAIAASQAQPSPIQRSEARPIRQAEVEGDFLAWIKPMEPKPTRRECELWAENELRVFAARSRRRNSVGRTRGVGERVGLWRFHPGRSLSGPMIAGHEARSERHDARITVGSLPLHGRRGHLAP
jgi:hypothetical protein